VLRYLQIRDFALIEAVELEFRPGLTVLTGETGAGKSMIVDALELLAGGRAGAEWVRSGAERAEISATVDITATAGELLHLLEAQAVPAQGELVLRRVIGSDGRSRAWLGGQSVPLQVLQAAAALLFDIHGQHEFQSLVRPATQRLLLDSYGRLEALSAQVRTAHSVWLALLNRSVELESAADERGSRLELLRYQQREIEALQLRAGEIEELHAEHARLANRGRLLLAARTALDGLYEAEGANAHALIARSMSVLRAAAAMDAALDPLVPLLDEAALRIKDASHTLQQYLDALEIDPEHLRRFFGLRLYCLLLGRRFPLLLLVGRLLRVFLIRFRHRHGRRRFFTLHVHFITQRRKWRRFVPCQCNYIHASRLRIGKLNIYVAQHFVIIPVGKEI